ncbi:MAG: L-serine ammonia-lyase, iron-sulfur-dependent, subunit alpha [Clostridiales bacterium]|nr:L-serine ammonia-lyase, iron-sulfur-dependent, subunit alpha [Clostridiales bacterium]
MEHALKWWAAYCRQEKVTLPEAALRLQEGDGDVRAHMGKALTVMREAAEQGMNPALRSMSGMTGGQAVRLLRAADEGRTAAPSLMGRAEALALAIAENNAAMGRIVAAPTAGACGILPAALLSMQAWYGYTDGQLTDGLLVAGVVGDVIAARASVSGARGGCQAECGSAAAMAAAACVYLRGGSVEAAFDACGFALMNVMGLVCDPVQGLVEVPCVFRNVSGVAGALAAADLALAGIPCPLPPDEVIDAMKAVGDMLPAALRETGEGGCAACPSARRCAEGT